MQGTSKRVVWKSGDSEVSFDGETVVFTSSQGSFCLKKADWHTIASRLTQPEDDSKQMSFTLHPIFEDD